MPFMRPRQTSVLDVDVCILSKGWYSEGDDSHANAALDFASRLDFVVVEPPARVFGRVLGLQGPLHVSVIVCWQLLHTTAESQ